MPKKTDAPDDPEAASPAPEDEARSEEAALGCEDRHEDAAETSDPGDAETSDPGDAETSDPGDAETSDPGDAETPDPGDAETPDPGDPEAVERSDTEPADTSADSGVDPADGLIAAEARDEPLLAPHGSEPTADHHAHSDHHEDEGGSFVVRALWLVALLLVGVGIGLWAAPRLAPLLPAGMAPVAVWLSPPAADTESETRLADLEARLGTSDARIGELAAQADVTPDVEALVTEAGSRLEAEIAELREQVIAGAAPGEAGAGDGAAVRQRLDRLEAALEGQSAQVANLIDQLSGTDLASSEAAGDAVERLDVYRADLEGLRAEVATLSDDVSALGSRVDEIATDAERRVGEAEAKAAEAETQAAEAETQIAQAETRAADSEAAATTAQEDAARQTAIAKIGAALTSGANFSDALYSLGTVPAGLSAVAGSGAVPLPQLRDRFAEAAHVALRASNAATGEDAGLAARSRAFIGAQFATRSLSPHSGDDADAVLSRMEAAVARGDLTDALSEAETLPPEARTAMDDWLRDARRRLNAEQALMTLSADAPATN